MYVLLVYKNKEFIIKIYIVDASCMSRAYMVNQRIGGEAVAAPLQACEFPEPVKQAGLQGAR